MIDLECPSCGRMGSVPNDKANSRMVCKKCHMVFHMTPTGRTMLGEPPVPGKEKDKKSHAHDHAHDHAHHHATAAKEADWVEGLFEIKRVKTLVALLVVAVSGLGYMVVMASGIKDDLTRKSQLVADSLLADDLATVKGFGWREGAEALPGWYNAARAQVEELKKNSPAGSVLTSVFVIEENHAKQEGSALLSFAPAVGSTREQNIAKAAGSAPASPDQSVKQILTYWVLDRGSWRIDAPKTAVVGPPPAPSPAAPATVKR